MILSGDKLQRGAKRPPPENVATPEVSDPT